jgi:hypothetical protein
VDEQPRVVVERRKASQGRQLRGVGSPSSFSITPHTRPRPAVFPLSSIPFAPPPASRSLFSLLSFPSLLVVGPPATGQCRCALSTGRIPLSRLCSPLRLTTRMSSYQRT